MCSYTSFWYMINAVGCLETHIISELSTDTSGAVDLS